METCYGCFNSIPDYSYKCPICGFDKNQQMRDYPAALKLGSVLGGRYIVGKVLGQGGFGITYIAREYKTSRIVAIKEYFPETLALRSPNKTTVSHFTGERQSAYYYGKECFMSEAKTLSKFNGNENIVRVYNYFEENGTAYFTMEYIRGESLKNYIKKRGGRISFEEARLLLLPVMKALEGVHQAGVIHRDISPDNIFITTEGTLKLIDFGAARYSLGDRSRSLDVVLKHGYAPIEQYTRRGRQGPYTDVYSMSATFYRAITGRIPPESIDRMSDDNLIPPSNMGIKIPQQAETVLLSGLEVFHRDRLQTMRELRMGIGSAPLSNTGASFRSGPSDYELQIKQEAERKAREEAERKAREEAERKAREEAERKVREEAERKAREEAERRIREEAERKAREEAERKVREEAERKVREEAERRIREEAERKAREEAERRIREEAERKAREEAERKAREEAERKAREEAERKAREETERRAREEAERKAREEAERRAREEAERKAREEAERKAREEAERKAREEAERKAREEAERKAREEAERKAREEAERKAREEAERRAREEAERKAREEAERKAREEAERRAREEAERKAREVAERKAREEAERKAREEAKRKAKEEAERKAREKAEQKAREEEERKAIKEIKAKEKEERQNNQKDGNKKRRFLRILIPIAAVIVIGIVTAIFLIPHPEETVPQAVDQTVYAPSLTGLTIAEAEEKCQDVGLSLITSDISEFSDSILSGCIISQSVEAGAEMGEKTEISVILSKGKAVTVPDLTGLSKDQATAELEKLGLKLKVDSEAYSDKVAKGCVISIVTKEKQLAEGDAVSVVLSKGVEQVKVPKLTGKTAKEAKAALEKVGLKYKEAASQYSDTVAKNKVIKQDKKADSSVDKGSTVTVTLSKGKKPAPTEAPTEAPADNGGYYDGGYDSGSYDGGYDSGYSGGGSDAGGSNGGWDGGWD